MDDIFKKRELVIRAYPHSRTWPAKVKKMTDAQVTAIFLRFQREKKI